MITGKTGPTFATPLRRREGKVSPSFSEIRLAHLMTNRQAIAYATHMCTNIERNDENLALWREKWRRLNS